MRLTIRILPHAAAQSCDLLCQAKLGAANNIAPSAVVATITETIVAALRTATGGKSQQSVLQTFELPVALYVKSKYNSSAAYNQQVGWQALICLLSPNETRRSNIHHERRINNHCPIVQQAPVRRTPMRAQVAFLYEFHGQSVDPAQTDPYLGQYAAGYSSINGAAPDAI